VTVKNLYPDAEVLVAPYAAGTVINIGDGLLMNSNVAKSIASATLGGSEAIDQLAIAPVFLGIALERKLSTDLDGTVEYAATWVGDVDVPSTTYSIGDLLGVCRNSGVTAIEAQKYKKVTDIDLAVGRVIYEYTAATTKVRAVIWSNLVRPKLYAW
jgi:hypothetical protein